VPVMDTCKKSLTDSGEEPATNKSRVEIISACRLRTFEVLSSEKREKRSTGVRSLKLRQGNSGLKCMNSIEPPT
jgi:hypothetical protein